MLEGLHGQRWRVTSEENPPEVCKSMTLTEYVPLIAKSPGVTDPAKVPVERQPHMAALLTWQRIPISKSSAIFPVPMGAFQ